MKLESIIRIAGLPFVFCFWTGCTPRPPTAAPPPLHDCDACKADDVVERVAVAVAAAAPHIDSVWPGMWPPDRRIALFPYNGGLVLIGRLADAASFGAERMEPGTQVPDSLRRRLRYVPGRAIEGAVDFALPLGDERIFASSYMQRMTHFDQPITATTVFLYHELFHFVQATMFAAVEYDVTTLFDELARFTPGSESDQEQQRSAERALLTAALTAASDSGAVFHLREYYRQLDRRLPRRLRIGEEYAERIEGSATLVSYEAAAIALGTSRPEVLELVLRDLAEVFPEDRENGWEGLRRWHMYAAGTAKAMLASRLVTDWQKRVALGATLDDVLLEYAESSLR